MWSVLRIKLVTQQQLAFTSTHVLDKEETSGYVTFNVLKCENTKSQP